jgi:hypothetical protein
MNGQSGFTYKGWTYDTWLDVEPDENCKIFHFVKNGNTEIHFDWSPYSYPTQADIVLWIDLGCPERVTRGSMNREDLDYIKGAGLRTWTFDLQSRDSDWSRKGVRVTCASDSNVREYAAGIWPSCDVTNIELDLRVESICELHDLGEAIARGEA